MHLLLNSPIKANTRIFFITSSFPFEINKDGNQYEIDFVKVIKNLPLKDLYNYIWFHLKKKLSLW